MGDKKGVQDVLQYLENHKAEAAGIWSLLDLGTISRRRKRFLAFVVGEPILQAILSMDEDSGVRKAVAWNPVTPPDVLRHLAHDPDEPVRLMVAGNGGTDEETRRYLAETDPSDIVRSRAAGRLTGTFKPDFDATKCFVPLQKAAKLSDHALRGYFWRKAPMNVAKPAPVSAS